MVMPRAPLPSLRPPENPTPYFARLKLFKHPASKSCLAYGFMVRESSRLEVPLNDPAIWIGGVTLGGVEEMQFSIDPRAKTRGEAKSQFQSLCEHAQSADYIAVHGDPRKLFLSPEGRRFSKADAVAGLGELIGYDDDAWRDVTDAISLSPDGEPIPRLNDQFVIFDEVVTGGIDYEKIFKRTTTQRPEVLHGDHWGSW